MLIYVSFADKCSDMPPVENGQLFYDNVEVDDSTLVDLGEQLVHKCNHGYRVRGLHNYTCVITSGTADFNGTTRCVCK